MKRSTMRLNSMPNLHKNISALALTAAVVSMATPAFAQDTNADSPSPSVQPAVDTTTLEPTLQDGKQIYDAAAFARFAPQTANDMVRRIPGFSVTEVSEDRGLGEASQNVTINGQRITGKSNDAQSALSRIPASSVIRFEVADAATFNISGINGQVLNVVAKDGGLEGNFSWRFEAREVTGINPRVGEVNLSGKLGKGNFTLGIDNNGNFKGGGDALEFNRFGDASRDYIRTIESRPRGDRPRIAGSYNLQADNGNILNVNGALEFFFFRRRGELDRFPDGVTELSGLPEENQLSLGSEDEWNYEVSGDYELAAGPGRLKLIAFRRFEHSDFGSEFRVDPTNGNDPEGQRFDQVIDESETVLRSEYRWKGGKNEWQISFEGALNSLDADADLFNLVNGNYEPEVLTGATARVEEKRAQAILSYSRPLSDTFSLQTTLGGEYSQLNQSGSNGLTRTFWRPKGSIALTWKASPTLTVSSKFQRKVGQLDFGDFLASVDVQDSNNNASNAQLVPPQSWLWENEANLSLGNAGSIKFKLDGELISDLVDQVPINATEEAVGNLPSAKRLRGEINGSFVLDSIGFRGAKLDALIALQTTSVRDPLLLTSRPISNRGRSGWSLEFRHDVPGTQWAWELKAEQDSDFGFYRLDYFGLQSRTAPFASILVEHKDVFGLKVRAAVMNLLGQREKSEELFYVNRRNGPLDFSRTSEFRYGRFFALRISGAF